MWKEINIIYFRNKIKSFAILITEPITPTVSISSKIVLTYF